MVKNLLTNRKGTAEVIGSVLFIVIILFFFSNVYLWHDQATREMNTLYSDKLNSPIRVEVTNAPFWGLKVTNNGGVAATISVLWINEDDGSILTHNRVDISGLNNRVVSAGSSLTIWMDPLSPDDTGLYDISSALLSGMTVTFKVITTVGNSAACVYPTQ